jgi:hypothetical protein
MSAVLILATGVWRAFEHRSDMPTTRQSGFLYAAPFCAGNFTQQAFRATYGAITARVPDDLSADW